MRAWFFALLLFSACASSTPAPSSSSSEDLAAARALFERNIQAIQDKDRDAYLSCYRPDERLIRSGDAGMKLGFAELAASTSSVASEWPTSLEAHDLSVQPIAPGLVYGIYRYKVTIAGQTTEGWSERVFVRDPEGWRIAVTTAFQN